MYLKLCLTMSYAASSVVTGLTPMLFTNHAVPADPHSSVSVLPAAKHLQVLHPVDGLGAPLSNASTSSSTSDGVCG